MALYKLPLPGVFLLHIFSRQKHIWNMGASMTASWRDVFLLLFRGKITGQTKEEEHGGCCGQIEG